MKRLLASTLVLGVLSQAAVHAEDADDILAGMTLEQKLSQLFVVGYPDTVLTGEMRQFLTDTPIGGFYFAPGRNYQFPHELAALTHALQTHVLEQGMGIPLLLAVAHEGGTRTALHPMTGAAASPGNLALGVSGRPEDTQRVYRALGNDLRACGINLNLAPTIAVAPEGAAHPAAMNTFGASPALSATLGAQAVTALRGSGVIPAVRHFPGLLVLDEAAEGGLTAMRRSPAFQEADLAHVRSVIEAGAEVLIAGHVSVSAWDPLYPVSLSTRAVTGILRDDMGYTGVVMTDALGAGGADRLYAPGTASALSVAAGVDLHFQPAADFETLRLRMDGVLEAVARGTVTEAQIDAAARRILELKRRHGLFQAPAPPDAGGVGGAAAHTAAESAARNGVVVVQDLAGLLPLQPATGEVLVISPPAFLTLPDGPGRFHPLGRTAGHFVRQYAAEAREIRINTDPTPAETAFALAQAEDASLIILTTVFPGQFDAQAAFVHEVLALGKPTVLIGLGSPEEFAGFADADVVVAAHGLGMLNLGAAIDTVFGRSPGN